MTRDELVAYLDEIEHEILSFDGTDIECRVMMLELAQKILKKVSDHVMQ